MQDGNATTSWSSSAVISAGLHVWKCASLSDVTLGLQGSDVER